MPTLHDIVWAVVRMIAEDKLTLKATEVLAIVSMALVDAPANWECLQRAWEQREVFFQSMGASLSRKDLERARDVIRSGGKLPKAFSEHQRAVMRAYEAADAKYLAALPRTNTQVRDCLRSVYHAIILHAETGRREVPDAWAEQDFGLLVGGAQ